ncbi:uncharacterized protein LOC143430616 [Xylocopa sonorina]|uniref:uncharacterized protein LOC143430616 n=1 Tax=Xylocopa sonorina TaxID=1818115 RepID=UPI00403A97CA
MFAVFCLLLLLGLGHCQDNDLPSKFEIESSINRTIEEVERQVREDPNLPRLTRQDIVSILRNITSQDLNKLRDRETLERARKLYQRALMVVLPYNANQESPGSLKDLYTKPPMTRIVPDVQKLEDNNGESDNRKVKENYNGARDSEPSVTENLVSGRVSFKAASKESTTMKNQYKNHRETYSDVHTKGPSKQTLKLDATPVRFTFNLENLQKNSYSPWKSTTTRYPVYRNNETKASTLEIVYSTSVTDEPTTKPASKEISIDLEAPRVNQNVLTSSQWRYNAPPSTTVKPTLPSKLDKIPFLPTINIEPEERLTASSSQTPEIFMQEFNDSSNTFMMNTVKPTSLYVTPMPTETSSKAKYSSTYSLNSAGFRQATTSSSVTSTPMRSEVMDLLASIGLRPDNNSNVEDVYKRNKDILDSRIRVSDLNNILGTIASLTFAGDNAVPTVSKNTIKNSGSEIKRGVENLTPDVQMLFQRFGLQTSNLGQTTTSTTQRTTVNLNSYTNFKPLPTSNVKDQEMKQFLARFGLGVSDNRKQKSMKVTTEIPSVIEVVPENMRGILENIGLISRPQKSSRNVLNTMDDMKKVDTSRLHVFKPHEVVVDDDEKRSKINKLLDTVKLIQESNADDQNVREAMNNLTKAAKVLKDGPDPMKFEEIDFYNEGNRNDVKRQKEEQQETSTADTTEQTALAPTATPTTTESTETTTLNALTTDSARAASGQGDTVATTSLEDSSTSTTPPTTTTPSTTTSSNLMALEESFGGTTKQPDTSLPPKRKNGLYFLVDWNSFLEVGEEDKEKINLRFQPKAGDRTRFLPVTVP